MNLIHGMLFSELNYINYATNEIFTTLITHNRFNYRATAYMVQHGFYQFLNWFDERAWYPLGKFTVIFLHDPVIKTYLLF